MLKAKNLPPLTLYRGDTSDIRFQITDQSGAPYPLTGWSFTITFSSVKEPVDSSTQTGQIAANMADAATGWIAFPRSGLNLAVGTHYFDIEGADAAGKIDTFGIGVARVLQDIKK